MLALPIMANFAWKGVNDDFMAAIAVAVCCYLIHRLFLSFLSLFGEL